MRYVVAYVSDFDNDLKQIVVEAEDPIHALHKGVSKLSPPSEHFSCWLNDLCRYTWTNEDGPKLLEEIKKAFFNNDSQVSIIGVTGQSEPPQYDGFDDIRPCDDLEDQHKQLKYK